MSLLAASELIAVTRAVIFDADDTLFRITPSLGHIYCKHCKTHGIAVDAQIMQEHILRVWKGHESHHINAADAHRTSFERERSSWREFCALCVLPFGMPANFDDLFADIYEAFANAESRIVTPGIVPLLAYLRERGKVTGVLSNNDERLPRLLDNLSLSHLFDYVMVSAELGYKKPARECYGEASRRLDLPGEGILYIGDSYCLDYLGARNAGWHAVWFNARGDTSRDGEALSISSFQDLLSTLEDRTAIERIVPGSQ